MWCVRWDTSTNRASLFILGVFPVEEHGAVYATVMMEAMSSGHNAAQVVPVGPGTECAKGSCPVVVQFELQPAHGLPEVDLSVSLRSRYLSQKGFARAVHLTHRGRVILGMFVVGVSMMTAVFYLRHVTARRIIAPVAMLLMLPSTITGISVLRYDMVCLLLRTYDTWFSLACSTLCFMTLGLQFADSRAAIPFIIWSSTHINVFVDANLRGVKRMTMMNLAAATSMSCSLAAMKFGFTTDLQPFAFFRRGRWEMAAEDVVSSAGATVIALVIRNVARFRESSHLGTSHQVYCVSYRCSLRIVRGAMTTTRQATATTTTTEAVTEQTHVSPIQALQYVPHFDFFDPHRTLFKAKTINRRLARVAGISAFSFSIAANLLVASNQFHYPSSAVRISNRSVLALSSLVATVSFSVVCIGYLQAQLFKALITSFDFVYLSLLLTFVHLTACDYFQWSTTACLAILNSWIWIHWVFCVDALSPLAKSGLRVHTRFPAVVLSTWFVGWIMLQHHIVVVDKSAVPYDRVLWSGTVLGHRVTVRMMPLFFNAMATLMAWLLRLLYHAWTFDGDMLLMLDGRVAYSNYMSRPRVPGARRQRIVSRLWSNQHPIPSGH